jgi:predicted nucleic acid-binding protein
MRYLIDTGVWLRLFDRTDVEHPAIRTALLQIRANGNSLAVGPQIIAEFWNVSTRPKSARGGYGNSVPTTERRVQFIERFATVLEDSPSVYRCWRQLLPQMKIQGTSVHDARLVALMEANGITRILTLNASDFKRYAQVTVMTPSDVSSIIGP